MGRLNAIAGVVALAGLAAAAVPAATPAEAGTLEDILARGELRVPLIFRDGKTFLGPLPLGEAPLFPA